jgi:hypothetical protein
MKLKIISKVDLIFSQVFIINFKYVKIVLKILVDNKQLGYLKVKNYYSFDTML